MAENNIPKDIAQLSFEEALHALEDIVKGLESGEVKLDQAIENYERGAPSSGIARASCAKHKRKSRRFRSMLTVHRQQSRPIWNSPR